MSCTLHATVLLRANCCRSEKYRGSSVIKLLDGDIDSLKPWKTTNQVHAQALSSTDITMPLAHMASALVESPAFE